MSNQILTPDNTKAAPRNLLLDVIAEERKAKKMKIKCFPVIAIVGDSGTGKSYSMSSLPPDETLVFNIERKILPFEAAVNFDNVVHTIQPKDFEDQLRMALKTPQFRYIVVDSVTKYLEYLYDLARKINKGYDIYNWYNDKVFEFLELVKQNTQQFVILNFLPEMVKVVQQNGAEVSQRRIATVGKRWEGRIEKEFSLVLYTDVARPDRDKPPVYRFLTNNDGINSAKTPPGMFMTYIPNDLLRVCKRMEEFWKLERTTTENSDSSSAS